VSSDFLIFFIWFILIIMFRSGIFFIATRKKKETKWNEKFYNSIEIFEDSELDPSIFWSFLTDPKKAMNFNYKNKLKSISFEQPLKLGSMVKIRVRRSLSSLKGYISVFSQGSKIAIEYHAWPQATRYICEIEIMPLESKTRYILRLKAKHLFVPLIVPILKKLIPILYRKANNIISDVFHNCLLICQKSSEEDQKINDAKVENRSFIDGAECITES